MKLRQLNEKTNKVKPKRVCEFLDSIGIKFEKDRLEDGTGANFDLIDSTPEEVGKIVVKILKNSDITDNFKVSHVDDSTTIKVRF